jgi:hypothetical protein
MSEQCKACGIALSCTRWRTSRVTYAGAGPFCVDCHEDSARMAKHLSRQLAAAKDAIKEAWSVLQPRMPECCRGECQGCSYEWDEAVKILAAATAKGGRDA